MHGVEGDGLLLRVGSTLDRAILVGPGGGHGGGESAEATYREITAQAEEKVDVRQRPFAWPPCRLRSVGLTRRTSTACESSS